jgi:hypothetical protein
VSSPYALDPTTTERIASSLTWISCAMGPQAVLIDG